MFLTFFVLTESFSTFFLFLFTESFWSFFIYLWGYFGCIQVIESILVFLGIGGTLVIFDVLGVLIVFRLLKNTIGLT